MVFNFKCGTCAETFNVEFKYLLNKECLICPNCSNTLTDNNFQKIKGATQLLHSYNENSTLKTNGMTHSNPNHFHFTIQ